MLSKKINKSESKLTIEEFLKQSPTETNIKALSMLKGVSESIAEKYFQAKCNECESELLHDEVAINLKMLGRRTPKEKLMCKNHFCEFGGYDDDQYNELMDRFKNSNCVLFNVIPYI